MIGASSVGWAGEKFKSVGTLKESCGRHGLAGWMGSENIWPIRWWLMEVGSDSTFPGLCRVGSTASAIGGHFAASEVFKNTSSLRMGQVFMITDLPPKETLTPSV